jgi:hypothetical protein
VLHDELLLLFSEVLLFGLPRFSPAARQAWNRVIVYDVTGRVAVRVDLRVTLCAASPPPFSSAPRSRDWL